MTFRYAKQGDAWSVFEGLACLGTVFRVNVAIWTIGPEKARGQLAERWTWRDLDGRVTHSHWRNRDRAAHALSEHRAALSGAA